MPAPPAEDPPSKFSVRRAWKFFTRALRLRCPHCGTRPIFIPLAQTRSLHAWFTPLDGCPHCGYAFDREVGYFLLAIWAVNYGVTALLGAGLYLYLEFVREVPLGTTFAITLPFVLCFGFCMARHSKALFLALDHFFDPPVPFHDDPPGGGEVAAPKGPQPAPAPGNRPASPPGGGVIETR